MGRIGGLICRENFMPLARFAVLIREEGILYADLDLDFARARRRLFDPVGHDNRPDVFRLVVDDRPKPHVVSLTQTDSGDDVEVVGPVPGCAGEP